MQQGSSYSFSETVTITTDRHGNQIVRRYPGIVKNKPSGHRSTRRRDNYVAWRILRRGIFRVFPW